MALPSRKEWATMRDHAGGSAGMVKGVSVGLLLDAYHKAGAGKTGLTLKLAQVKPSTVLADGLKKYRAGLPANKTALRKIVDDMIEDLQGQIKDGQMMANPVHNLTSHIRDAIAHSAAIVTSGDRVAYQKLWKDDIRGAGTGFAMLLKIDSDARVKRLYDFWLPFTQDEWDFKGDKVAGTRTDPAQVKARVQNAAKLVNRSAKTVQSEMAKLHLTA
jgi:hypothetical protein